MKKYSLTFWFFDIEVEEESREARLAGAEKFELASFAAAVDSIIIISLLQDRG